jgi:transposase
MGRAAKHVLACDDSVRKELERIGRSLTEPKRRVDRARIILACLADDNQSAVANRLGTRPNTVGKWRDRFIAHGLAGIEDELRSGAPVTTGKNLRKRVLDLLETPPPKGQAMWDGIALAKALGAKKSSVYALLAKDGIQLQRSRSWCVSTNPEFAAKAADVIGLYLNPPQRAMVFCVDEKPSIQALSRKVGYVETSSGKIVRGLQSTYKRNGTLNLFAALQVATGEVIVDNYCTHKRNEEWLKAHPNVTFHFTPTSASWLNMVEIWLGILTRKALKGASFNTTQELSQAIEAFCETYNKTAKPFVWKKREVKGAQLRNTIANLLD